MYVVGQTQKGERTMRYVLSRWRAGLVVESHDVCINPHARNVSGPSANTYTAVCLVPVYSRPQDTHGGDAISSWYLRSYPSSGPQPYTTAVFSCIAVSRWQLGSEQQV